MKKKKKDWLDSCSKKKKISTEQKRGDKIRISFKLYTTDMVRIRKRRRVIENLRL